MVSITTDRSRSYLAPHDPLRGAFSEVLARFIRPFVKSARGRSSEYSCLWTCLYKEIYSYQSICLMDMQLSIYLSDRYTQIVIDMHSFVCVCTFIGMNIHWLGPANEETGQNVFSRAVAGDPGHLAPGRPRSCLQVGRCPEKYAISYSVSSISSLLQYYPFHLFQYCRDYTHHHPCTDILM